MAAYPWQGKTWEDAANAANNGLNGQGYIVHSVMQASRVGTCLTYSILALMAVQILLAIPRDLWRAIYQAIR